MGILAHRAQVQSPGRSPQNPGSRRHQQERQVDQGEVIEENRSQDRDGRQARNRQRREGGDLGNRGGLAEDQPVEKEGETRAEQGHADTRHMLAKPQADGEQPHEQAGQHAGGHGRGHAQPEAAGEVGRGETGHGGQHHDAFDAQVENAGALGEKFSQGGENQRRGDADQGGEESYLAELSDEVMHGETALCASDNG
ncbi:hypothetical protein DESC_740008 [Desulfosarcina cetonica]|nr:hypothetical protein DESC_740008 [Desulfosarcina cetonica]